MSQHLDNVLVKLALFLFFLPNLKLSELKWTLLSEYISIETLGPF